MQIGAMNHPAHDPVEELGWMKEMGLDFIDLTMEPPGAAYWQIDVQRLRGALDDCGMGIVGHTAYYLPLGHPFEEVRKGAVAAFLHTAEVFARLGCTTMNIHPDKHAPLHSRQYLIERNILSLREIVDRCREIGVEVMIENLPASFNTVEQLGEILDPLPDVALHLDLGHTNLDVQENTAESILAIYGHRVRHIHFHDNLGGHADLHLPLGAGTIDIPRTIRALKSIGYDGSITLEVFAPDHGLLQYSAEKFRRMWSEN